MQRKNERMTNIMQFVNLAGGSDFLVGRGLNSCTDVVQVSEPFELDGRGITLIDTPGFDDTTKSDTDILRMISEYLASEWVQRSRLCCCRSYANRNHRYKKAKKLAGVIYIHRISDFRMGGISTRNFRMFRQLCGDTTLKNVVIVTNMWGEVEREMGEAREAELAGKDKFFKPALDKGALMLRHENTRDSAYNILKQIIQNHPIPLQIQREIVDEKKDCSQTVAADEINGEVMLQMRQYRNEARELRNEMEGVFELIAFMEPTLLFFLFFAEAIRVKEQQRKREVELNALALRDEMNRVQAEAECLVSAYCEEKRKLELQMQVLGETARREGERARGEYLRQTEELERRLWEARGRLY